MKIVPVLLALAALAQGADRCVMIEEFTWNG
jgi:hypothetical protein